MLSSPRSPESSPKLTGGDSPTLNLHTRRFIRLKEYLLTSLYKSNRINHKTDSMPTAFCLLCSVCSGSLSNPSWHRIFFSFMKKLKPPKQEETGFISGQCKKGDSWSHSNCYSLRCSCPCHKVLPQSKSKRK